MSFLFDLSMPQLTPAVGKRIECAVADAGAWPVRFHPPHQRRRWLRVVETRAMHLELLTADSNGHVLADPGGPPEECWRLRAGNQRRLADTLLAVATEHRSPFLFSASWRGLRFNTEEELTATELAALVAVDALSPRTRYRVWSPLPVGGRHYRPGSVPT